MEQDVKKCPICEKDLFSDATVKEFCQLCSMVLEKEEMIVKIEKSRPKYFCCNKCYKKYVTINKE
jgi:hypothetical protein